MDFENTYINGLVILTPKVFTDERGCFFESYNKKSFNEAGIDKEFVQDNESHSTRGTLRGLHFQKGASAQGKLVRVIHGNVLDVAVDIRPDSETFGRYISLELSKENKKMLFVPRGFAHGFVCLSEEAILQYKCDNFYDKSAESGINFADPQLSIEWPIPLDELTINERDKNFQTLENYIKNDRN
jgi:dTDP-4-dehydrorhamnose 3,5-epimerase